MVGMGGPPGMGGPQGMNGPPGSMGGPQGMGPPGMGPPGMGMPTMPLLITGGEPRTKEIGPSNELRIMVNDDQKATVKIMGEPFKKNEVITRSAEIFGSELVMGLDYPLAPGTRTAIFTWHGCTVQVAGTTAQEYDAPNTMMKDYVNCAAILERKRRRAEEFNQPAPRCLVVGSASSGKSTFCQILVNYGLRRERYPLFVELDPRYCGGAKHTAGHPAAVTAVATETTDGDEEARHRMSFFFGYNDWTDNPRLYEKVMLRLARCVDAKLSVSSSEESKRISHSGCIINAPSDPTLELVKHMVNKFQVDVIFVLDNESLGAQLQKEYPPMETQIEVVALQKSGGVVQVTPQRLRFLRMQRISHYFYGPKRDLQPSTLNLNLMDMTLLQLDASDSAGTMLPLDQQESRIDDIRAIPYTGTLESLKLTLLALVRADKESDVPKASVAGYCLVLNVDQHSIQLLCPCAPPLPSRFFLVGDAKNIKFEPRDL